MKRMLTLILVLSVALGIGAPAQSKKTPKNTGAAAVEPFITFVELGSVKCVPCRMMQPVMKNIEARYGSQIKVIFYDVWKEEHQKFANDYSVRVIPTQVFLNKEGKEVFRHEGFFPESEIDALLAKHGLKPTS